MTQTTTQTFKTIHPALWMKDIMSTSESHLLLLSDVLFSTHNEREGMWSLNSNYDLSTVSLKRKDYWTPKICLNEKVLKPLTPMKLLNVLKMFLELASMRA